MYKRNIKRKWHFQKKWWIYIVMLCIILCTSIFIYRHIITPQYWQYVSARTSRQAMLQRGKYKQSPKLEYDFTYLQGCPHCMSVQSTVAPILRQKRHDHNNLLVINARNPSVKHYLITSGQSNVPTISVRFHGYLLYQYTGINHKMLTELLHGINPNTHHPFSHNIPKTSIVENTLTHHHQYSREPANNTLNY